MLFNGLTRIGFAVLLTTSLIFHAFVFTWWWLLPPVAGWLLNVRIAYNMGKTHPSDYLFAGLFFPAEFYTWVRLGHFVRAWTKFFFARAQDNWELQAKAESGRGGNTYLMPFVITTVIYLLIVVGFDQLLSVQTKSDALYVGWRVLGAITLFQTFTMLIQLVRPHKGLKA
jgi:hypothetical protein